MTRFEELYNSNPTQEELRYLKDEFEYGSFSTSWEDYYWGVKCITVYDKDDFSPSLLIEMLNNAFKYGLSPETSVDCYIGANRILAAINNVLRDYEKVVDNLGAIIKVDSNVPAWIYYDYVAAQNKTSALEENLKNPQIFLSNLGHVDKTVSHADKRQAKIFKEFLVLATDYLSNNHNVQIETDVFLKAAEGYGLVASAEWIAFEHAANCEINSPIEDTISEEKADIVTSDNTIIDETLEKKYHDLLDKLASMQDELDEKNKELEAANQSLAELIEANNDLEERIKKYSSDINDYESAIKDKDEEIALLEERISVSQEGTVEKKRLEAEIANALQQRTEMKNQINKIKEALNLSEKRLTIANEEIKKKTDENQSLKQELDKVNSCSKPFSYSVSAEILARCKAFEFMTGDKLANWLYRNLSYEKNWWQDCVLLKLSNEQFFRAEEYEDLHDFDMAALIRLTVRNWRILSRGNYLTQSDRETSEKMFEVRNNLSHNKVKPVIKERIMQDLRTLSDFLSMINANTERNQVRLYIKEIAKMQID